MELVTDENGHAAPRLIDLELTAVQAGQYHEALLRQVVRMLCAGLIHGDLSEYNVLMATDGPVIIDFPQAVDASVNNSAAALLKRDVDNLAAWFGRFAPELLATDYGREIWALYKNGKLRPDVTLTGHFEVNDQPVDVEGVVQEIEDVIREEQVRQRMRQAHQ